jgi:GH15 family glucan-1,4-alpha-glucosidase
LPIRQLEPLGEHALRYAFEPDSGIWEYRERARVRTYSAALCWAACDRLGQIAHRLRLSDRAQYWHVHAVAIRDKILAEAWDEKCGALTGVLISSGLITEYFPNLALRSTVYVSFGRSESSSGS